MPIQHPITRHLVSPATVSSDGDRNQSHTVLIIEPRWLEKILDGHKTIEIRGAPIKKHIGKRIYLAASGSAAISGCAELVQCLGPLTESDWHTMRPRHCVPEAVRPYGAHTYASVLCDAQRVPESPFERKRGAIIWQEVVV